MKPSEPQNIGDILEEFLKVKNVAMAASEGSARETWSKVAGRYIADATQDAFLKAGTLTLSFTSSTVKADVQMNKRYYIREMNRELGGNYVRSIRFL